MRFRLLGQDVLIVLSELSKGVSCDTNGFLLVKAVLQVWTGAQGRSLVAAVPTLAWCRAVGEVPLWVCVVFAFVLCVVRNTQQTYLLTYLRTPWSRVLLEKLTGLQLVKKFPALYGTRRYITVFTSARHLSLSWANSIQSPPLPLLRRSILILTCHLRPGLPSGLFNSGFPTRTLCTPLPYPIHATCPAHFILLDFTTLTILGKE